MSATSGNRTLSHWIETARTHLRPWTQDDATDLLVVFGDPAVMRFWNTPPATTDDEVRAMIGRSLAASVDQHQAFTIVLKESGRAIGLVNYHHREKVNRRLEIGFILAAGHQGHGLAHEAVSAFVRHCFESLNTHRIEALTDPDNHPSRVLLEQLGFKQEGDRLRQRIILGDGCFGDQIVYARLADEC